MIGWAQTLAQRFLGLDPSDHRDVLLIGQAVIETSRRLTRLEEQVADLKARQDEFDLTAHR